MTTPYFGLGQCRDATKKIQTTKADVALAPSGLLILSSKCLDDTFGAAVHDECALQLAIAAFSISPPYVVWIGESPIVRLDWIGKRR